MLTPSEQRKLRVEDDAPAAQRRTKCRIQVLSLWSLWLRFISTRGCSPRPAVLVLACARHVAQARCSHACAHAYCTLSSHSTDAAA